MSHLLGRSFSALVAWWHRKRLRGAARLFSIIGRILNCEPLLVARTRHGVRLALTTCHYIDTQVLRHGYYEPEVLDAILEYLQPGDVFWDVGANFGLHAVTVAKLAPDCRVVAFEPNPIMMARILQNAELNRTDLDVVSGALWDKFAVKKLRLGRAFNPGTASLLKEAGASGEETAGVNVLCHSGDDFSRLGSLPLPNVLKIDTEGVEARVFKGLREILGSLEVRAVIYEGCDARGGSEEVRSILDSLGFSIRELTAERPESHANFVAFREN